MLLFLCIPISCPSIPSSFSPSVLYLPSHSTLCLPFPKEIKRKLSYCRQNALSILKTHKGKVASKHRLLLYVCLSRLTRGKMFLTSPFICPSDRPSIHSLVRYQTLYCETNEPISMQIGTNLPRGQWHATVDLGVARSKVISQEDKVRFGGLARTSFLTA